MLLCNLFLLGHLLLSRYQLVGFALLFYLLTGTRTLLNTKTSPDGRSQHQRQCSRTVLGKRIIVSQRLAYGSAVNNVLQNFCGQFTKGKAANTHTNGFGGTTTGNFFRFFEQLSTDGTLCLGFHLLSDGLLERAGHRNASTHKVQSSVGCSVWGKLHRADIWLLAVLDLLLHLFLRLATQGLDGVDDQWQRVLTYLLTDSSTAGNRG